METVNFQCGHCGNLMGVSTEFLGQQVRCPHCQGIVVAPASPQAPSAPAEATITFESRPDAEPESIFSPPDASSEDLFGRSTAPRIELPADRTELLLNVPAPAPPPQEEAQATIPEGALPPTTSEAATVALTASQSAPAWMTNGPGDGNTTTLLPPEQAPAAPLPLQTPSAVVRPARRPSSTAGLVTFIVIFSLVSYSLLATVYIILLIYNRPKPYPLLEFIPDVDGDNPGVKKSQGRTLKPEKVKELNRLDVPESLRVGLGKTIRVGDLEVKPLRIELRKVGVFVETNRNVPQECQHDSLVLTLEVRNLAADYSFSPLDNYFDRNWKNQSGPEPMTYLTVGKKRFFGGPALWVPRKRSTRDKTDRQWVDAPGRSDDDIVLAPGASLETTVCTDGEDPEVARALQAHEGKLLYRVQVRRGVVEAGDRRVSATAVVGVEFTDQDYRRQ